MLTIENLRDFGADTEEGLKRCFDNETFYLGLVKRFAEDNKAEKLAAAIGKKDYKEGFELAHNLKGSSGNLALTPIYKPVSEMTELLRSGTDTDYSMYVNTICEKMDQLASLTR